MAKFVYRMQNILDIKQRLETQAKTEYAEAAAREDEEREKLKQLVAQKELVEEDIRNLSESKLDLVKVRHDNEAIKTLEELMKQQAVRLRIAQTNLEKAREKLGETVKDRKIHEKLKEKAFDQFKVELNDEEKKEVDQLTSFSYNNRKENG